MDIVARATQSSLAQALRVASKGPTTPLLTHDEGDSYKKLKRDMKNNILSLISDKSGLAAFQTLFSIQFELCSNAVLEDISSTNVNHLHFKMSRMVLKRFNKLVKEEEEGVHPFHYNMAELETFFCSLEDKLTRSYNLQESRHQKLDERMNPCMTMAKSLMLALIKAYKLRDALQDIANVLTVDHLDKSFYHCGRLFTVCSEELEMDRQPRVETESQ
jgi:hypothetical protein